MLSIDLIFYESQSYFTVRLNELHTLDRNMQNHKNPTSSN